ncbi:MAG TPA: AEC family transporter [Kiloniellaceae bacterium]|nr:AEC family transporter [Kiloniellaceae bacterium]
MSLVLNSVFPIFALIACGFFGGRRRLVSAAAAKGLSDFVYYLAVPALLFRTMATTDLALDQDLSLPLGYFGATVLVFLLTALVGGTIFQVTRSERALQGMSATFSNTVLVGIPLVLAIFGEAGLVPLMLIITFHSGVLFSLTILAVEFGRGGQRLLPALARVPRALAVNPVILGLIGGLAFSFSGLTLPLALDRFAALLGGASAPCALFALGASMAGFKLGGNLKEVCLWTLVKLVLHPLLVALTMVYVVEVPRLYASVAVLTAALPAGINVFIWAKSYEIYVARAASMVLISTLVSTVTLSLLVFYLGSQ